MYVVMQDPYSNEHSSYHRPDTLQDVIGTRTFQIVWRADTGFSASQQGRATLDGVEQGPTVTRGANGYITLTYTAPADGCFLPSIKLVPPISSALVFCKPFIVNASGAPIAPTEHWLATTRFQYRYGSLDVRQVKVPVVERTPTLYPLKARAITPYQTVLSKSQQWVSKPWANMNAEVSPAFARSLDGSRTKELRQKYFYNDAVYLGAAADGPHRDPKTPLVDGPRTIATIGHVYTGVFLRGGNRGGYLMDTEGRIIRFYGDWRVDTQGGPHVRDGELPYHGAMIGASYMNAKTPAQVAHCNQVYSSAIEYVGDLTHAGNIKLKEPWEFILCELADDGTIDLRNGHEAFITDTLNDRVVWWWHGSSHSADNYHPPHFAPQGFVAPPAPTGTVTYATVVQLPQGSRPFGMDIDRYEKKLYIGCMESHQIYRCDMDGSNLELWVDSPVKPTYAMVGANQRLGDITQTRAEQNRALYMRDGGPGVGTLVFPQKLQFNHDCTELMVAERYTACARVINKATRVIDTRIRLTKTTSGGTSSASQDWSLVVDREGLRSPVDDVYIFGWRNTLSRQFAWAGGDVGGPNDRGAYCFQSGAECNNGPLNLCFGPDYGWGQVIGEGQMLMLGSAAGFQNLWVTRRQPTDVEPDWNRWKAGCWLFKTTLGLSHGYSGQALLGLATMDELGALTDADLLAYWEAHKEIQVDLSSWSLGGARCENKELTARQKMIDQGVPTADAFLYFVRWETQHLDYSTVTLPPDTLPPSNPEAELNVSISYEA